MLGMITSPNLRPTYAKKPRRKNALALYSPSHPRYAEKQIHRVPQQHDVTYQSDIAHNRLRHRLIESVFAERLRKIRHRGRYPYLVLHTAAGAECA